MGICSSNLEDKLSKLSYSAAEEITYNFTIAKVLKVYDGDTLTIGAYYDGGFKRFSVRIYGIDCAEMKGGTSDTKAKALAAKNLVEQLVLEKIITIEVLNNKLVDGVKIREKYGRLLAKIYTPDGRDVAEELCKNGLANRYYGGKKEEIDS